MVCPKCGSTNVNVQAVSETQIVNKRRGCLWWLLIGWWWIPFKWIFFFGLALLAKIFAPKRQKLKTKHISKCICQDCGKMWNA